MTEPLSYATWERREPTNWWGRVGALAATIFWLGFCTMGYSLSGPDRFVILCLLALPIAALVMGVMGRRHVNRWRRDRVLALYAACSGIAGLALCAFALVPQLPPRERANRVMCASNLRQIAAGLDIYAADNNGASAPDLASLIATCDVHPRCFVCPSAPHDMATGPDIQQIVLNFKNTPSCCSYVYTAPALPRAQLPPSFIMAYERLEYHEDGINVLTNDGVVTWHPKASAQHILKCLAAGQNPPPPEPASR